MELPGLPEGVEAVAYAVPPFDSYYMRSGALQYANPDHSIGAPQLVVRAKAGFLIGYDIYNDEWKTYSDVLGP